MTLSMRNSTIKTQIGKCIDCPEDSKEKPLIDKRCKHHYDIHRASVNAEKKAVKIENENSETEVKKVFKKIPRRSKKGQKEDRQYTIKRLQFFAIPGNQRCFVEGCNSKADTIEHTRGRKGYADDWGRDNKISLLLDERFWKPCCNFHNLEFERNSDLSEKYQLSKISGKQKIIKR